MARGGGTPVYTIVVSCTVIFLFFSFAIPIALGLFAYGTAKWPGMGPWDLGRGVFSLFAVLSIVAMVLIFVIGVQPPNDDGAQHHGRLPGPDRHRLVRAGEPPLQGPADRRRDRQAPGRDRRCGGGAGGLSTSLLRATGPQGKRGAMRPVPRPARRQPPIHKLDEPISSKNLSRSMLPPEMIATMGPGPAFPVSAAATESAPAPSEITLAFSAISRMAFLVSSRLTTIDPSTTSFMRSHMLRKYTLGTGAVHERRSPIGEHLRCPACEGQGGRSRRLRLRSPYLDLRLEQLDGGAHAGNQPAAADGADHRCRLRQVFEDLQAHGRVADNEIVIVEGVDEGTFDAGKDPAPMACHATSWGTGMSLAPNARIRSIFAAGAVSITTTVQAHPPSAPRRRRPDRHCRH